MGFALSGEPISEPSLQRLLGRWSQSSWSHFRTVLRTAAQALETDVPTMVTFYPDLMAAALARRLEEKIPLSEIRPQTAAKYARTLALLETRISSIPSQDLIFLRDYSAALLKSFPDLPTSTARPLPRDVLQSMILDVSLDLDLRAGLFVAWKTASRWDDILRLPLPLTQISNFQLLVAFLTNTKATKAGANPFDPRFLCVIDWGDPRTTSPPKDILDFLTQSTGELCSNWPTRRLESLMSKVVTTPEVFPTLLYDRRIMDHYSAHSVKKGAIKWLWENLEAYNLSPILIERISKHKNPNGEPLSAECIRYAPDLTPIALSLDTHIVSRVL